MMLLGLAWAGTVPVDSSGVEDAYRPRRVAVLVGVQAYEDSALKGLRYAETDAQELGAVLSSPDIGGFDRVFVVTGHDATTRESLWKVLGAATADLQRDDTFLLYLSGHGTLTLDPREGSRLWFLPSDAQLDTPDSTGMAVADLEEFVSDLPARRRVLILDTCHNGRSGSKSSLDGTTAQLLQGLRGEPPAPRSTLDVSESEARLYAAQFYQPAMEDPELGNGVYTHFLIQGLTDARDDADLNGDALVDVAEAHQYARDHTIAYTGGLQVPRAEYRIVGREEIFLSGQTSVRSAAEQALISACDMLLNQARLLINGIPRGELPGLYAVEPGRQVIEVQTDNGETLYREKVKFEAGTTIPVEDLMRGESSALSVMGQVTWLDAYGFHPLMGGAELSVIRPWRSPHWLRPDLHVGFSVASGDIEDRTLSPARTGIANAGLTMAWSFSSFYVGPTIDARLPFRLPEGTIEQQSSITGAAGLTMGQRVTLSKQVHLELAAEAMGSAQPYDGVWEPVVSGDMKMGLSYSW